VPLLHRDEVAEYSVCHCYIEMKLQNAAYVTVTWKNRFVDFAKLESSSSRSTENL